MCETHRQKLRWGLQGGTTRIVSKVTKEASLTSNWFLLLVQNLLLKGLKLGLELLLLHGESIHFVQELLLLLEKIANITNQLLLEGIRSWWLLWSQKVINVHLTLLRVKIGQRLGYRSRKVRWRVSSQPKVRKLIGGINI